MPLRPTSAFSTHLGQLLYSGALCRLQFVRIGGLVHDQDGLGIGSRSRAGTATATDLVLVDSYSGGANRVNVTATPATRDPRGRSITFLLGQDANTRLILAHGMEHLFRSPPMTESLARAIRLISPHLDFIPNETSRSIWESDQNGACCAEYDALTDTLAALAKPMRVLEVGPGLGRSIVFFSKKFGWEDCELHAYEGDGESTKYTLNGPRFDDSFCGTISELRRVLNYNGITNVTIHDAKAVALTDVPGPFDLLYGFYTIGFHWSLEHFFDEVLGLIGKTGIAVFTVPSNFQPFPSLEQLPYSIVEKSRIDAGSEKLLVLGPIAPVE